MATDSRDAATVSSRTPSTFTQRFLTCLLIISLVLPGALSGCSLYSAPAGQPANSQGSATQTEQPPNRELAQIGQDLFNYEVSLDTTLLNQLVADPSNFGITLSQPTLGEFTLQSYQEDNAYYRVILERLSHIDSQKLNQADALTMEIIQRSLDQTLRNEEFFYYIEPLFPNMGVQSNLPSTFLEYSFRSRQDIDDYLALLNDTPRYFKQIIDFEWMKSKRDLLFGKSCFDQVIAEIDTFLLEPIQDNVLIKSFDLQLATDQIPFSQLSGEERAGYSLASAKAVEEAVYPAFRELKEALLALKPLASADTTIASYAKGKEYYALEFESMGFSQTPEEAARLLDARINDFLATMAQNNALGGSEMQPSIPSLPDSFPAQQTLEYLSIAASENFPQIKSFGFTVEETPEELPNDLALAYYKIPAVDDSENNRIFYYPKNITDTLSYLTTLAHEGFPGHMYQTNYFAQTNPHPVRKLLFSNAYMEGYAMYAESLSLNYFGLSEQAAQSQVAYDAFSYAIHARADIGVNNQGWSLLELSTYLEKYGFSGATNQLYETVQTQPMVYLNYGLGLIEFFDLRSQAETQLGSRFDQMAYHDAILKNGPLPFDMLRQCVQGWIERSR